MPKELQGFYHHWLVEDIQELTHGWYEEPLFAGWEPTKNFVDTEELTGLVTVRVDGENIDELDTTSAVCGGNDGVPDDEEDDEENIQAPEAEWGSLDGCTPAQRCVPANIAVFLFVRYSYFYFVRVFIFVSCLLFSYFSISF